MATEKEKKKIKKKLQFSQELRNLFMIRRYVISSTTCQKFFLVKNCKNTL